MKNFWVISSRCLLIKALGQHETIFNQSKNEHKNFLFDHFSLPLIVVINIFYFLSYHSIIA